MLDGIRQTFFFAAVAALVAGFVFAIFGLRTRRRSGSDGAWTGGGLDAPRLPSDGQHRNFSPGSLGDGHHSGGGASEGGGHGGTDAGGGGGD